jgi:hypothetical protein
MFMAISWLGFRSSEKCCARKHAGSVAAMTLRACHLVIPMRHPAFNILTDQSTVAQLDSPKGRDDMKTTMKLAIRAGIVMMTLAGVAGTAAADETTWQKDHPRRVQVNKRLANQNKRTQKDVKAGTVTKAQVAALHKQDHQVRQEERDMASQNGSHLTKPEQKVLNQQENGISKEIPPK